LQWLRIFHAIKRYGGYSGRHLRQRGALSNDFNVGELLDHVPIAGEHDPDVAPGTQRPRECGGNGGEAADADKIVHLRRDE